VLVQTVKPLLTTSAPHGARILAFPLARRRDLLKKLAEQMLARSPKDAERHLSVELERHRRILRRRQLTDRVVHAELRAFEGAVRHELWHRVFTPPATA
jgi:hypothetical protein